MTSPAHDEPTAELLRRASEAYDVDILSFDRKLEKLASTDFLPRYNRLRIKIRCRVPHAERPLYLTVRRHGSKIGAENFYTVPFFPEEIPLGTESEYELLSFDSFALPFESISVEICRHEDYLKRRVSTEHIERAKKFTSRITKNG